MGVASSQARRSQLHPAGMVLRLLWNTCRQRSPAHLWEHQRAIAESTHCDWKARREGRAWRRQRAAAATAGGQQGSAQRCLAGDSNTPEMGPGHLPGPLAAQRQTWGCQCPSGVRGKLLLSVPALINTWSYVSQLEGQLRNTYSAAGHAALPLCAECKAATFRHIDCSDQHACNLREPQGAGAPCGPALARSRSASATGGCLEGPQAVVHDQRSAGSPGRCCDQGGAGLWQRWRRRAESPPRRACTGCRGSAESTAQRLPLGRNAAAL